MKLIRVLGRDCEAFVNPDTIFRFVFDEKKNKLRIFFSPSECSDFRADTKILFAFQQFLTGQNGIRCLNRSNHVFELEQWKGDKKETEKTMEYQPGKWNPYPSVVPPTDGEYLVEIRNGKSGNYICVMSYTSRYRWSDTVVAFRELPPMYSETLKTKDEEVW